MWHDQADRQVTGILHILMAIFAAPVLGPAFFIQKYASSRLFYMPTCRLDELIALLIVVLIYSGLAIKLAIDGHTGFAFIIALISLLGTISDSFGNELWGG